MCILIPGDTTKNNAKIYSQDSIDKFKWNTKNIHMSQKKGEMRKWRNKKTEQYKQKSNKNKFQKIKIADKIFSNQVKYKHTINDKCQISFF